MFSNSTQYNANFMSALFNIALMHKSSMTFDPNLISDVSQLSGLSSVGALLLEEYLISEVDAGPSSAKRNKSAGEDVEDMHWIHLAM